MKRPLAFILLGLLQAASTLLLQAQPTETYTFTTNRLVPDGNPVGLTDVHNLNSAIGAITSLKVRLKLTGEFNGDLYGYVKHASGFTVLLNRPGKTVANAYGYADSGLDVTFQTGATNGDSHLYQNVTIPADGSPLTGTWEPDGRIVDPTNVTDAFVRSTSLTTFNGLNAAGEWTLYLADVDSGGTNMLTEWSLEITGAAFPTLSLSNPADIVYGAPPNDSQLNAIATYNSTNVPGTFTYAPASVMNAGLGQTLFVTFTPSNATGFLPISTNIVINVLKAPLAVTANDTYKNYGAAMPAFTASYNGFVNGDTAGSLDTPVTLSSIASYSSQPGTYTITASGAASANYAITYFDGTLTVFPVNTPPLLSAITNITIQPDAILAVRVHASDPEGDQLTFSLDPGAPPGAFITNVVGTLPVRSTNTIVFWNPTRAQASTTHFFTVRVTDNGSPPMSATQTFMVTVLDYLELTIGSTNVEVGQSASVPISLGSDGGVTHLEFTILWPSGYFTNVALGISSPEIAAAFLQDQVTNLLVVMDAAPGQALRGAQQIAELSFSPGPNQPSAFVPFPVESVIAANPDSSVYTNYVLHPGMVAVVQDQPLLLVSTPAKPQRNLTRFGKLGFTYQLQYSTNLALSDNWYPLLNYTQTNRVMTLDVDSSNSIIFYRLFQP